MKTLSVLNCGLTRPSKFNSLPLLRSVTRASVIYFFPSLHIRILGQGRVVRNRVSTKPG